MNLDFLILLIGFGMVAIAGNQIAKFFQKIKFPLVTGLIVTGIIAGPSLLNFMDDTLPTKFKYETGSIRKLTS